MTALQGFDGRLTSVVTLWEGVMWTGRVTGYLYNKGNAFANLTW